MTAMKCAGVILLFCCLFNYSDAWLSWSKSYFLKAVLDVPIAKLHQPYQVWVNGDTKKSRVDFYNGMDKMYRQWNELTGDYEYLKINPQTNAQYTNRDVCTIVSEGDLGMQTYVKNSYLPVKDFKFKNKEKLNDVEAEKWQVVYEYIVDHEYNVTLSYTVWVQFKKTPDGGKTPIPLRYDNELKVGSSRLDYFRHDYLSYEDIKPDDATVTKPLGLKCEALPEMSDEPVDPLLEYVDPELEHLRVSKVFDSFKKRHNRNYGSIMEHFKRLSIFKNNLRYMNSMNRQYKSFSLAVNRFADLTDEEMLKFMGTVHTNREIDKVESDDSDIHDDVDEEDEMDGDNVKASFDWREYGAVTPIKDQTTLCGSCYAFTTAAAVESGAYAARGCKDLAELSEQAIMDCSWGDGSGAGGNFGCGGGTYEHSLQWVQKNGLPTKEEYGPYLALEGLCSVKNMTKLVVIKNYEKLPKKKRVIKDALRTNGPLLVAINTSPKSFFFYSSGVYNDTKCLSDPKQRTHGVTLIGYGQENGQEYWTIKNSFGFDWGERGYMRLATIGNICGLKNFAFRVGFRESHVNKCFKT